jgi:hypothetical protein
MYDYLSFCIWSLPWWFLGLLECPYLRWLEYGKYYGWRRGILRIVEYQIAPCSLYLDPRNWVPTLILIESNFVQSFRRRFPWL